MIEQEAKTKWCPFARVMTLSGNAAGNIGTNRDEKTFTPLSQCIGSACMAWRWEDVPVNVTANSGYCGMAGKP